MIHEPDRGTQIQTLILAFRAVEIKPGGPSHYNPTKGMIR